jgi:ABC-type thiamin/hydroxymethylpyrimidine transport system permease subunit
MKTIENEAEFQDTGLNKNQNTIKKMSMYYFSTQELLIGTILGVMGGVVSGLIPFSLLVKTWYPFVGGTQMVSGHHILWLVISYGIIRKKPAILLTAIVKGFVNFLVGADWGVLEIVIMTYEAIFLVIGFYLMEKLNEKETKLGWGMAAGIGNMSQTPFFWIATGKIYILHWSLFVMAMMFAFASGFIIAGFLGHVVVNRLQKSGIV